MCSIFTTIYHRPTHGSARKTHRTCTATRQQEHIKIKKPALFSSVKWLHNKKGHLVLHCNNKQWTNSNRPSRQGSNQSLWKSLIQFTSQIFAKDSALVKTETLSSLRRGYLHCNWCNVSPYANNQINTAFCGKTMIHRGYLLIWGEYQIYFIECVENIRIFMSAQHEWKFRCFQLTRWNIFGIY